MLEKLKRRVPDVKDEALLSDLLSEAESFLKAYTRRAALPKELEDAQVRIAAILVNRMGMEGETARSEGGIAHTVQLLPDDLRAWLNGWRLAKTL